MPQFPPSLIRLNSLSCGILGGQRPEHLVLGEKWLSRPRQQLPLPHACGGENSRCRTTERCRRSNPAASTPRGCRAPIPAGFLGFAALRPLLFSTKMYPLTLFLPHQPLAKGATLSWAHRLNFPPSVPALTGKNPSSGGAERGVEPHGGDSAFLQGHRCVTAAAGAQRGVCGAESAPEPAGTRG